MIAVINEKQLTEEQEVQLELEGMAPEKFNPEVQFKVNKEQSNVKDRSVRYGPPLTREECAALMAQSQAPIITPVRLVQSDNYPTYSLEDVQYFMLEHEEYKEKEQKNKMERTRWETQVKPIPAKTTRKKRVASTKA